MSGPELATPSALAQLARRLEERLPAGAVERDAPLARFTTYRLGGPEVVLVHLAADDDLAELQRALAEHPAPVLAVGRGSNLLVSDRGFAGVAVVLGGTFDAVDAVAGATTVSAGGGVALPVLARRCAALGLTGLEFYVGIPGSVGGAVRMNAGGHGRDTAAVLRRARVANLGAGSGVGADPAWRDAAALELGYRQSSLGPSELVLEAELAVTPAVVADSEAAIAEIVRWRRDHQPGGSNAGSVFRNPPGDSAGRLIDAVGLKGLRVGGVVVSEKHANFFQAEAGATADDVRRLVADVQRRVRDTTGVELVPELTFVGFDRDLGSATS